MVSYFIRVNRELQRLRTGQDDDDDEEAVDRVCDDLSADRASRVSTDPESYPAGKFDSALPDSQVVAPAVDGGGGCDGGGGPGKRACTMTSVRTELGSIEFWRAAISESLAVFLYVFLAGMSSLSWHHDPPSVLQVSLAYGLAAASLLQCFGHVSGGHVNPALTLAMLFARKVSVARAIVYVVAQCLGAIAGAAALYGLVPVEYRGDLGVTTLQRGVHATQGFGIEALMTFLMTFTFFATLDRSRREHAHSLAPLTIGAVVTMDHLVGLRLTGCGINPARSLGPAFIKNKWTDHWVYWAGPITGAVVAGLMYVYIFDPQRFPTPAVNMAASVKGLNKSPSVQRSYGFSSLRRGDRLRHSRRSTRSAPGAFSIRSRGQENGAYDYGSRLSYQYAGSSRAGSSRSFRRKRIPYLLGDVSENEVSNQSEPEYNTIDTTVRKY